ncbi:cytochrome P450 [Persicimonas caeni]|uniref:Cytochrome P450 n=1 Tax=Persicimonas caeni TaxID=2292766 RepID=A0A4Y6PW23_PERCE|nr:cytochrome P450 [Persicimonas caeni]QDG52319.1 cytochrome P450 [Persicimonas caeni]QED33541.1 cytochrome P450 [Persicimonas caeni]
MFGLKDGLNLVDRFKSGESAPARPPGPRGWQNLKVLVDFATDQIGCFRRITRRYGSASFFKLGTFDAYLFTDPEAIEEVLLTKSSSFEKDALTHELDVLLGKGLLTSEGQMWRHQRRLISPNLRRKQIAHYADVMVERTRQMLDDWEDGQVRPLHRDAMEVTLRIVVDTLFNLEMDSDIHRVGQALDTAMEGFHEQAHTLWRFVPEPLPTPMRAKFEKALEEFDALIYKLIDQRRQDATEGDDLLYRLIAAVDDEGNQMTDGQLRDEVITLFLAGHETTALAIMYAWYLMSDHPWVMDKVHAEVDEVLGERVATADDVSELPYTEAVIQETMRLYPPAWTIGREAIEDVEIAGWTVTKGAQVLLPQSLVHRDRRWFDNPDLFRPERWLDGLEDRIPRFAYFPFGGGPRICIGNYFAMMEAILVVATMAQQVRLENVSRQALRTQPSVTQRPATAIEMKVRRR